MPSRKQPAHHLLPIPGDRRDPQGLTCLMEEFLDWLRVRLYAADTLVTRQHNLRLFAQWCLDRDLTRPAQITRPILERYQRHVSLQRTAAGHALSWRTQTARLQSVRAFFRWLARNQFVAANPAADLELPRKQHRLPRAVLTQAEAEAVLRRCDLTTWLGIRDRAILETFYSTGMRRKELLNLWVADLDAERGTVFIRQGKGGCDRLIPIGERACAWIEKYLWEVRPGLVVPPDPGHLFLTQHGEALSTGRLTILAKGYIAAAGVGKQGACHVFRHTCATLMLEGGADVRSIQHLLGHASLESTQVYTHLSIRHLKAVHDATHPAARLHRQPAAESDPAAAPAEDAFTANGDQASILR